MSARDVMRHCRVNPKTFHLRKVDPGATPGMPDKAAARKATEANLHELAHLQYKLYAEDRQALLIVLQGIDAAGKDGSIRKVFAVLNPQGCHVHSFKAPTREELAHDFLWRIHKAVPRHGEVGIFNRSHYEDVLIARVRNLVPERIWRERYGQINVFESLLASAGTRVLKFFLYISKEEQAGRFRERLENEEKQWKFNPEDLAEREHWDDYLDAFQEALVRCSTPESPWYVIPANRKWYRNWLLSEITRRTLEEMDPRIPPPQPGLAEVKI